MRAFERLHPALLSALLLLLSLGSAFEISNMNPSPGEMVTIRGSADPNQAMSFSSSFEMNLPTGSGSFEYVADNVEVPQKPNQFSVTAKNVKDLSVGVKMGIWLTKSFQASGGTAHISHSDVPPGRYTIKIFGNALEESSPVSIEILAGTTVKADSNGKYSLDIDTSGIPIGDYKIEGSGKSKVIKIGGSPGSKAGGASDTKEKTGSNDGGSSEARLSPIVPMKSLPVTPDAVMWYAEELGLNASDPENYSQAKSRLNDRLKVGYWMLIGRGQELNEEIGTCQDAYCLTRGSGACTTCKDKENVVERARTLESTQRANASTNISTSSQAMSTVPQEKKGFLEMVLEVIKNLLGLSA
jgi:hypothetical protein